MLFLLSIILRLQIQVRQGEEGYFNSFADIFTKHTTNKIVYQIETNSACAKPLKSREQVKVSAGIHKLSLFYVNYSKNSPPTPETSETEINLNQLQQGKC